MTKSSEFIDFENLKMELSKALTTLKVSKEFQEKNKNRSDLSAQYFDSERDKIASLEEKIPQLEAILATEPPSPELPPRQPLFKVSGILEEFSVQKVISYFGIREYDPEVFAREEERNQVGGLLLAMTGNAAGSAVTGQSKVRQSDLCDFVRGKINGIPFHGWFGKTHIRNGDFVEVIVMGQGDHYVAYAIMLPNLRTISITPRCYTGREAEISSCITRVFPAIYSVVLFLLILLHFKGIEWTKIAICAAMFAGMLLPVFWMTISRIRNKTSPVLVLAEDIFTAIGFAEPKMIDLRRLTKKRLKQLVKGESPATDREMPSRRSSWVSHFYYY